MPPRTFTNPPPQTESAREARKSFFCDLCQKGYARSNEFTAHQSSYDHTHKQRLKDLKALNRNMESKSRKQDDLGSDLIKITPIAMKSAGTGGAGFKKGGFKSAFGSVIKVEGTEGIVVAAGVDAVGDHEGVKGGVEKKGFVKVESLESDTEDEGYECYDPKKPTDCSPNCAGRV